ncbi:MAG: cobalamin biosynthesis protein CbiA [Desulfobacteraceae bacterium]|nr:cobalamin biosynthesis protein CbiA [Desulfobacteraceae bacterium]
MDFSLDGIVIIVGNYGSGKTEIAVNIAVQHKRTGMGVRLADLDLVNPYFRSREAREVLTQMGIEVVLPPPQYMNADLPILDRGVSGMIRNSNGLTILDAGGDDVGATVIAALADALKDKPLQVFQVINPFRPYTDSLEGCQKIREEIESAAKIKITGLIGNANLIDDTGPDHIYNGQKFIQELSGQSGLPVLCITVSNNLLSAIDKAKLSYPVLPIYRQMVPPWRKTERFEQ